MIQWPTCGFRPRPRWVSSADRPPRRRCSARSQEREALPSAVRRCWVWHARTAPDLPVPPARGRAVRTGGIEVPPRRGGHSLERRDSPWFTSDRDGRVVAAGLQAWATAVKGPDRRLIDVGRRLLTHEDAAVRSVAADIVARAADPGDLTALTVMYLRASARLLSRGGHLRTQRGCRRWSDRIRGAGTGRSRVSRVGTAAGQLSAPPLGSRQLARGCCPLGTGAPNRDRTVAAGLSRPGSPLYRRARLLGPAPRLHRDRSARDARSRALRARGATHRCQLPSTGGSALLRWQPLAPGSTQLRGAGWGSTGRRIRQSRRSHSG